MPRPGRGAYAALLFVALVVNLPFLHQSWQQWRIDRDGVRVSAEVTDTDVLREETDPHYVVRFRLPEDIDPEQGTWPVEVDRASYQRAEESGRIGVSVLRGDPAAQRVEGEHEGPLGWIIMGVVDAVLVVLALLVWRVRRSPVAPEPAAGDAAE